jgi:hypothetical protein
LFLLPASTRAAARMPPAGYADDRGTRMLQLTDFPVKKTRALADTNCAALSENRLIEVNRKGRSFGHFGLAAAHRALRSHRPGTGRASSGI